MTHAPILEYPIHVVYSNDGVEIGWIVYKNVIEAWFGYVYRDLINVDDYVDYEGDFPHTSMMHTGSSEHNGRRGIGFDHAHPSDEGNQYTVENISDEVRWLYTTFTKAN